MITTSRLLPYLGTVVALFLAPGPSVVFVVSRAIALGRLAGLTAVAGNTLGLATQLLVVLGPGLADDRTLFTVLKLAGALYLLLLGIRGVRSRRGSKRGFSPEPSGPQPVRELLRQGWVVGVTNPKGLITYTSIAPDVITRGHSGATVALVLLGAIALAVALVCDGAWALASGTVRRWLGASPRRLELLDAGAGVAMIVFGVALAVIAIT